MEESSTATPDTPNTGPSPAKAVSLRGLLDATGLVLLLAAPQHGLPRDCWPRTPRPSNRVRKRWSRVRSRG